MGFLCFHSLINKHEIQTVSMGFKITAIINIEQIQAKLD